MLAVPGGQYRVRLKLSGPLGTDPSWLVGAIRATWGGMDVVNLKRKRRDQVVVTLRATRQASINVGDAVAPVMQGISVPGIEAPSAEVDQVEPVSLPALRQGDLLGEPSLSDEGDPGWGPVDAVKIGLSMLLIGTTVWLSLRVERKAA